MKAIRSRNWRAVVALGFCGAAVFSMLVVGICRVRSRDAVAGGMIAAAKCVEPMNWQGQFQMTVGL